MTMTVPKTTRLISTEMLYYHPVDDDPMSVNPKFVRNVSSDESPYGPKKVQVGPDWAPLDAGWVKKISILLLENVRPLRQVYPTLQEKDEEESKVVEIGAALGDLVVQTQEILMGETLKISPCLGDITGMRVRCRKGSTLAKLTVFPS